MKSNSKRALIATVLFATFSMTVSSISSADLLKTRTYTFKTYASSFQCQPGTPNNGHNYPTWTTIRFQTTFGVSGIYYPSKLPLNNTSDVELNDVDARPCAAYADLLQGQPGETMDGTATQKFSVDVGRTGDAQHECFRSIREDLKIVVKGHVFRGSHTMSLPVDDAECGPVRSGAN